MVISFENFIISVQKKKIVILAIDEIKGDLSRISKRLDNKESPNYIFRNKKITSTSCLSQALVDFSRVLSCTQFWD